MKKKSGAMVAKNKDFSKVNQEIILNRESIFWNLSEAVECMSLINIYFKMSQDGKFDNFTMTESINLSVRCTIKNGILSLLRAWDTGSDAKSFPKVAALLDTPGYDRYLRDDVDEMLIEQIRSQRRDFCKEVKEVIKSDVFNRLRLHRNYYIAHSIPQKANPTHEAYVGEDADICRKSMEIFNLLACESPSFSRSLIATKKMADSSAEAFWSCLATGDKR